MIQITHKMEYVFFKGIVIYSAQGISRFELVTPATYKCINILIITTASITTLTLYQLRLHASFYRISGDLTRAVKTRKMMEGACSNVQIKQWVKSKKTEFVKIGLVVS